MTKVGEAKILGGIGALLGLLTFVPYAGLLLGLVGLILVFIAVKNISEETKEQSIFHNYLMNFIFHIVAIVAVIIIMIASFGVSGGFAWVANLQKLEITNFTTFWQSFGTIVIGAILALLVAWIFIILGALYLRKSYISIATHTHVDLFRTTGLMYLIGAITIIVLVGFVILFVAKILEIVSYFSLPEQLPIAQVPSQTEAPKV